MSEDLEQRRLDYLERNGYLSDHLASFVEDQKCQAANLINNKGLESQLQYLMKTMTWSELVEALEKQREMLRRYHKQFESKLSPKGNK